MVDWSPRFSFAMVAVLANILMHCRCSSCQDSTDVIVVGAGIAGLSAAVELGAAGARVTVVDISSVFGGHAVMSQGGLAIVDTPVQRAQGIMDSADLARRDFHAWGGDPDSYWVDYYSTNSRREIYDWLVELGVSFESALPAPGNSVARMHQPAGRGLGLVTPIYRKCLELPTVVFAWNTRATQLLIDGQRVVGIVARHERTGVQRELRARAVVLATGGFQSNLDMVREYWPKEFRFPDRILLGSGTHSVGLGHRMAEQAGAELVHMDRQWNYFTGIPDFRYPGSNRGLSAANMYGIIVNAEGRRFANLLNWVKDVMPRMLEQDNASVWFIFDAAIKSRFVVSGSDWADFDKVERLILENPQLVSKADSIEELATKAGLPPKNLADTINRYNALVDSGEDLDFGRFKRSDAAAREMSPKIEKPPFFAMRAFPLTRKSMGGVAIDRQCRVLDKHRKSIPGLYAVGELTGLALINGKAALEGTFLGPCIVTGRLAGREIAGDLARQSNTNKVNSTSQACVQCHDLGLLLAKPRTGYWHFEKVHSLVAKQNDDCNRCHQELAPYRKEHHRVDQSALTQSCKQCHLAQE